MIVCLEGIDACGKGTHAELLKQRLNAKLWKFPDRNTPTGRLIYDHLEGQWFAQASRVGEWSAQNSAILDAMVFQALQLANRMEVASDIFKAAAAGNVVFDRYWPSGYAYGRADGLDGDYLVNLHRWLPQPDLFLLLDIDPKDSNDRRPDRRDRYERQAGLMEVVAGLYRELWISQRVKEPLRWVVVDARGSREETATQIAEAIARLREALFTAA